MIFTYNINNHAVPPVMYIARPNRKIKKDLTGVSSAKLKTNLRDIWEVNFEIDKYIVDKKGQKYKNKIYDLLSHSMEILIENIGWFRINSMPQENYSNGRWLKSFVAYGYETTLQDIDVVGLKINCGSEDSVEMYEENLNVFKVPRKNIQLHIKDSNEDPTSDKYWKLGLLNILEHEYLSKKGWLIGNIETGLSSLRGRQFDVNNQNLYQFIVNDVAAAYKCLFIFDRMNKKINAVSFESLGKDLNIELSLRNVINSISIVDQENDYYTRFRVSGKDSDATLLEYINYGSDKIENLNYCIGSGMLDEEIAAKYRNYMEFIENNRQQYADYTKNLLKLQENKSAIYEQQPVEEVDILFTNVSDAELALEKDHFETVLEVLTELHTDENGVLNIEGTPDYAMYISIKDVILPKILEEIGSREQGTHAEEFNYKTNWELYGINELNSRLTSYQRQVEIMKEKGYDKPWSSGMDGNEIYHNKQYQLYCEYQDYISQIQNRLSKLNQQIENIDLQIKTIQSNQKELANKAKIEHESWGFSDSELSDIYILYRDTDYEDKTIEILDTDNIDDIIQLAWDLLNSAKEELEIESHPQMSFEIDLDNIYHIKQFSQKANNINIGDFCFMELDEGYKTKQRIIGIELELVNFNDVDLSFTFSDMTTVCGKVSDYRFLLNQSSSSNKNSISRSTKDYISNSVNTIASQIFQKYFNNGNESVFPNGVSQSDIQKLQDALDGLINGELSLDELKTKLAQIDTLQANSAFVKYLETQFLVGNQADFKTLSALVANIDSLLAGTVSAEMGHLINLTANNVNVDEAFIREIIAAQMTVSMLKAGDITLSNEMRILSENGLMTMNGETLQIKGYTSAGEEYTAIQLGYDSQNKPSLIIRDETGAVMLDANGLHENIVPDDFIKSNMIGQGQVNKEHLSFNVMETDENGNIDASKVQINGEGMDIVYTSIKNSVDSLSDMVQSVELTGNQVFIQNDSGITPSSITITANVKNGLEISKWYIDGVENTTYVSTDKTTITIPSSFMNNKKSILVKVEGTDSSKYDVMSLYKVLDGADSYTVIISSNNGTTFKMNSNVTSSKATCTVYKGSNIIEPNSYTWYCSENNGEWNQIGNGKTIELPLSSTIIRKSLYCEIDV